MRKIGLFFVLLAVVASAFLIHSNVDCKATVEKIEEAAAKRAKENGGGSESWAEWAKDKISEGLGFKAADYQDSSSTNEFTKERAAEAYEKTGQAKDEVVEKGSDMGKKVAEESKKTEADAEDKLNWAKESTKEGAKEGYEAAKAKVKETYESGKDKLSHHKEEL